MTQRKVKLVLAVTVIFMGTDIARSANSSKQGPDDSEHEYAPIVEQKLDFQDFTLQTPEGGLFNLREYAEGKRVVIVNFSAAWCRNSNMNGPVVQRLYEKYKDRGLGVVFVMEYSNPEEARVHLNRVGVSYPVAFESRSRDEREKTTHFMYRTSVGDKRKWGTPFYAIIDTRDIQQGRAGAPLASRIHTVAGEIIEAEANTFLEARLGAAGRSN